MSDQKKLTTNVGCPVAHNQNVMTAGPRSPQLLQDVWFLEKLAHFDREVLPERRMHAKGSGAYGTFTVTNDITRYTRAKIFSQVGKKTELFARFTTVAGERGAADAERDIRGFAVKFYTEEGNWDLVGNNTPVFFLRDPLKFPDLNHAVKRDPRTNLRSANNINTVDFVVTVPNETTVNVDTNNGEVSVASTKGNVDVKNDFGNITVEIIEGALTVKTNSGTVTATSIVAGTENIDLSSDFGEVILKKAGGKDISLDSNSGNITLSEVRATGNLTANTDFGNTKFENGSADALHVETNSGKVSLTKLNISKLLFVKNDFGDIELNQAIAGSYDMHTNSGDITVDGAKNKLKADTDFGNITITNAQSVTLTVETNSGTIEFSGSLGVGPHMVKSDFGAIDISLPTDAKLTVDLKTDFGKNKSELPVTVILTDGARSDGDQIAGDVNGGGEQLDSASQQRQHNHPHREIEIQVTVTFKVTVTF